jgi:hypothetical protein
MGSPAWSIRSVFNDLGTDLVRAIYKALEQSNVKLHPSAKMRKVYVEQ